MRVSQTILLIALMITIAGCTLQAAKPGTAQSPAANTAPSTQEIENDIPPQEYLQQEQEDMIYSMENAAGLQTGTCNDAQCGGESETISRVCGSDERTYESPCDACKNPSVEDWIEGAC